MLFHHRIFYNILCECISVSLVLPYYLIKIFLFLQCQITFAGFSSQKQRRHLILQRKNLIPCKLEQSCSQRGHEIPRCFYIFPFYFHLNLISRLSSQHCFLKIKSSSKEHVIHFSGRAAFTRKRNLICFEDKGFRSVAMTILKSLASSNSQKQYLFIPDQHTTK